MNEFNLVRTTAKDPGFQMLIQQLDYELWNELQEDQATYDGFNKVPEIETAVLIYSNDEPVACGCFKVYVTGTIEVKRMFVKKSYRGKGLSKMVLNELERWAIELGFKQAILETSIHFNTAKKLYLTNGYCIIPNYPPYIGLDESVCMRKQLR